MIPELSEYWEHLERYRAVTLQMLAMVEAADLGWRPRPDAMSLGQQFVHIGQAEDFQIQGLLHGTWDEERVRLPKSIDEIEGVRRFLTEVRQRTQQALRDVTATQLAEDIGEPPATLRSWLWFILEHELHHKGQIALYLRLRGLIPPFFAAPLPDGARPDQEFRAKLGGV